VKVFKFYPDTCLLPLRRNIFAFIVIFALILICYGNTFHSDFHFDDSVNIIENKPIHMTEFTWQSIKASFFSGGDRNGAIYHPVLYRPVACFTLALNYYWGKFNTTGYHLFNIAVHILATAFLFLFIYHMLNVPMLKDRYGKHSYSIALLASLFWGLHPIQIDSVTFIVQRMSSMAGLFFIMAMYFYLRGRTYTTEDPGEQFGIRVGLYAFSGISGLLAMGCKENAVMLPFVILLFDLFFIQGIKKENIKRYAIVLGISIAVLVPITLALSGWETFSPKVLLAGYERREFTLYERLLTQPRVIFMYLGLLAYPMADRMSFSHDVDLSHGLFNPSETFLTLLFIVAIIYLAIRKAKQWPLLSFCILFFSLNHLIESSVFPLELSYEHRNYLPSMLLFIPVAILLAQHIAPIWKRKNLICIGIAMVFLVTLGYQTHKYNAVWKTERSFWEHVIKRNHNPRALFNYGGTLYVEGYLEEALTWWGLVAAHNEIYGQNHSVNPKVVPYGKTINAARKNLLVVDFVKQAGYGDELKKAAERMQLKVKEH